MGGFLLAKGLGLGADRTACFPIQALLHLRQIHTQGGKLNHAQENKVYVSVDQQESAVH